jgi:hypothetical protein
MNRNTLRELSRGERVVVINLSHLKYRIPTIYHIIDWSWSMVQNFIQSATKRSHIEILPRNGYPDTSSRRYRKIFFEPYKKLPWAKLLNLCTPNASRKTIYRCLYENDYKKWLETEWLILTPEYAQKCLRWAYEHKYCSSEPYKRVIWNDECSVYHRSDPSMFGSLEQPWKNRIKII